MNTKQQNQRIVDSTPVGSVVLVDGILKRIAYHNPHASEVVYLTKLEDYPLKYSPKRYITINTGTAILHVPDAPNALGFPSAKVVSTPDATPL